MSHSSRFASFIRTLPAATCYLSAAYMGLYLALGKPEALLRSVDSITNAGILVLLVFLLFSRRSMAYKTMLFLHCNAFIGIGRFIGDAGYREHMLTNPYLIATAVVLIAGYTGYELWRYYQAKAFQKVFQRITTADE